MQGPHHFMRAIVTVLLWARAVVNLKQMSIGNMEWQETQCRSDNDDYLSPEGSSAIRTVHLEGSKQES